MSKTDRIIGLPPIAETLLIPLCYRASEARQPAPLIQDPCAQAIIDSLAIDKALFKWREEQQVFAMLRARQFDRWTNFIVRSSAVVPRFRGFQTRPRWGLSDPHKIESWSSNIRLLGCYGYFDQPEPRLKNSRWMGRTPVLHDSARVLRLGLGTTQ